MKYSIFSHDPLKFRFRQSSDKSLKFVIKSQRWSHRIMYESKNVPLKLHYRYSAIFRHKKVKNSTFETLERLVLSIQYLKRGQSFKLGLKFSRLENQETPSNFFRKLCSFRRLYKTGFTIFKFAASNYTLVFETKFQAQCCYFQFNQKIHSFKIMLPYTKVYEPAP